MAKMIKLNPPTTAANLPVVPLEVAEAKVEKFLGLGFVVADGESYTKPKVKGKGRDLKVDPSITGIPSDGREYKRGENDGEDTDTDTGVDTGKELGANDVVRTPVVQDDRRKVAVVLDTPTGTTSNLPGLSGKSKEVLVGIAKAENVDLSGVADSKPAVKAAIEKHRADAVATKRLAAGVTNPDGTTPATVTAAEDEESEADDDK